MIKKEILLQQLKEKLHFLKERGMEHLRNHKRTVHDEIREKTAGYILAGFGVVAGLAWNDAIVSFIDYFFPLSKDGVFAKFLYAFLITFLVVVVSIYLIRILQKRE